jgi:pilus assembly protein CpaF
MIARSPLAWPISLLNALHPILGLLEDDTITEIEVNAWNRVYAKGRGWLGHQLQAATWTSAPAFENACRSVAEVSERVVNDVTPLFDGRLPTGERVNIVLPPCCRTACLTLRKFPREVMSLDRLEGYGSISREIRVMLQGLVLAKRNLIVSGGTESGKTSLLNALSRVVPERERIVTVEDALELQLVQDNWIALETLKPWMPEQRPVTISDLVVNTLRQSPDRIVVGEVRGPEALYLLRAFSTGHTGGLSTVHANSAGDALLQLQLLTQFANMGGASLAAIAQMVGRAIEIVVHVGLFRADGSRRVLEIIEVDREHPVTISPAGMIRYHFRTLVQFSTDQLARMHAGRRKVQGHWVFPQAPSPQLQELLRMESIPWPEQSLRAAPEALGHEDDPARA